MDIVVDRSNIHNFIALKKFENSKFSALSRHFERNNLMLVLTTGSAILALAFSISLEVFRVPSGMFTPAVWVSVISFLSTMLASYLIYTAFESSVTTSLGDKVDSAKGAWKAVISIALIFVQIGAFAYTLALGSMRGGVLWGSGDLIKDASASIYSTTFLSTLPTALMGVSILLLVSQAIVMSKSAQRVPKLVKDLPELVGVWRKSVKVVGE